MDEPCTVASSKHVERLEGPVAPTRREFDGHNHLKRRRAADGAARGVAKRPRQVETTADTMKTEENDSDDDVVEVGIPIVFGDFVCIKCFRNDDSWEARLKPFKRKYTLQKHLQIHIKNGEFDEPFQCEHPDCFETLGNVEHYEAHALRVHGVEH